MPIQTNIDWLLEVLLREILFKPLAVISLVCRVICPTRHIVVALLLLHHRFAITAQAFHLLSSFPRFFSYFCYVVLLRAFLVRTRCVVRSYRCTCTTTIHPQVQAIPGLQKPASSVERRGTHILTEYMPPSCSIQVRAPVSLCSIYEPSLSKTTRLPLFTTLLTLMRV